MTTCQCGLGLGNTSNPAPSSFDVIGALVAVRPDNGLDLDLDAFAGFSPDGSVANTFTNLPGFNNGGAAYGFSAEVAPFIPPILNPNEHLIMAFLVEFAPADFDAVSGNFLQFAAGSTDPGHQISLFNNYQSNVVLPPYSLEPCDFNFDQECNVDDINALMSLGTLNSGVPLTNANQRFDLNGDGIIDMQDVDEWLQGAAAYNGIPSAYKYGDANLDGWWTVPISIFGISTNLMRQPTGTREISTVMVSSTAAILMPGTLINSRHRWFPSPQVKRCLICRVLLRRWR